MTKTTTPNPCCGQQPQVARHPRWGWYVRCKRCRTWTGDYYPTRAQAMHEWNTSTGLVAELLARPPEHH